MSEAKKKSEEAVQGAGAIGGSGALADSANALEEARALLSRYEPENGKGVSLAEPSQGEARRFLASIRGLLHMIEGPSFVQHQEANLKAR